jgi:hypothetical protein
MWLMERENAATVKLMQQHSRGRRRSPEGGTAVFGEEPYGDGCGVQGEGRGWEVVCLTIRDTAILGGDCAPALIPLVQPGKGR